MSDNCLLTIDEDGFDVNDIKERVRQVVVLEHDIPEKDQHKVKIVIKNIMEWTWD